MLGNYFTRCVDNYDNDNLKYIWFDFHRECRKMKWENLSKLMDKLTDDVTKVGYFEMI
jgi:hypothetical protein